MNKLVLYSTLGCHLCEQAKSLAEPLLADFGFGLDEVDIADDAALMETYGIRIPVLQHRASGVELGWPFAQQELRSWLQGLSR